MQFIPFLIGIVILGGGVVAGIFLYRKNHSRYQEMKYQKTSTIAEVTEVVDSMAAVDVTYRHYCELKGVVRSETPVMAPYTGCQVAYYTNRCLSVTQQVQRVRTKNGGMQTFTTKQEQEVASESSPAEIYITDASGSQKIYIDKESFGKDMDLIESCDRFEATNSPWMQQNRGRFQINISLSGANHLGYRLIEKILPQGQPVYLLGEVYKRGDRYYLGKAVREKKPSVLSCRTEDEMTAKAKGNQKIALIVIAAAAIIGAGICVFSFTPLCRQMMEDFARSSYSDGYRGHGYYDYYY